LSAAERSERGLDFGVYEQRLIVEVEMEDESRERDGDEVGCGEAPVDTAPLISPTN
jgi:hypothetical protein